MNFKNRYQLLAILFFLVSGLTQLSSQQSKVEILKGEPHPIFHNIDNKIENLDSTSTIALIQKSIYKLWGEGYLEASLDTVINENEVLTFHIYQGNKYTVKRIALSSESKLFAEAAGLKNYRWNKASLSEKRISTYATRMIDYLENIGYPFAQVKLDSITFEGNSLSAKLAVKKGKYIVYDTLEIKGDVDISNRYMERYLGIAAGLPYRKKTVIDLQKRLNNLPFASLVRLPKILFENGKARVEIDLKKKNASRFDFLIGVLPSSQNGQRKIEITGEFTAEMYNKLGRGEYLYASFQRLMPETQELELRLKYPYLLGLPLGIDTRFELYRSASDFLELDGDVGLLYQLNPNTELKASWNVISSRLIEIDTTSLLSTGQLPNQLDINYNSGGLHLRSSNLDYRYNPRKGYEITIGANLGVKKILRNRIIEDISTEDVDFVEAYDTLNATSLQSEIQWHVAYYIPTLQVGVIKLGSSGRFKFNNEQIFTNEFYRIGGNRLLRGFDEQSIRTDKYAIATAEFRLLLNRNSYLSFPFVDFGVTSLTIDNVQKWDTAVGLGLGLTFSTNAGIFNVSFASGRRLDNAFDFANTKVHFGYESLF